VAKGWRTDWALAGAFAAVAWGSRWALRSRDLYSWDSGLLASGIRAFDFAAGHPHPPYYPLAIAAGKVIALWLGPVQALVALAVLASGVMAGATYLVARSWLERPWAAFAAALVILSPTALFNGTVALTYAEEGAASAVVAWAAWRCRMQPTWRRVALLAIATSLAIGIRPSSLFLLAPLAGWAVWRHPRIWPAAAAVGAIVTLAWAVPMLWAGGGLQWFLRGNSYQSQQVVFRNTVFQGGWDVVPENAVQLASYVPWELPYLAAVAVALAITAFAVRRHSPAAPAPSFLAAWSLPSLLFFLFLYAGWPIFPSGYVLALVPPAAVACATALRAVARAVSTSDAPRAARSIGLALVALLLLAPVAWAASWPEALAPAREADAWARSWATLESEYPANETALITFYGWFWCRIDHPEYLTWGTLPYWNATGAVQVQVLQGQGRHNDRKAYEDATDGNPFEDPHAIPPWVKQVVLVHGPPGHETYVFKGGLPVENRTLASGLRVSILDPSGLRNIEQAVRWFDDEGRLAVGV
jgi:hypothetical protein